MHHFIYFILKVFLYFCFSRGKGHHNASNLFMANFLLTTAVYDQRLRAAVAPFSPNPPTRVKDSG